MYHFHSIVAVWTSGEGTQESEYATIEVLHLKNRIDYNNYRGIFLVGKVLLKTVANSFGSFFKEAGILPKEVWVLAPKIDHRHAVRDAPTAGG